MARFFFPPPVLNLFSLQKTGDLQENNPTFF